MDPDFPTAITGWLKPRVMDLTCIKVPWLLPANAGITMRQWPEQYRGSAGVLGEAIEQFLAWADAIAGERPPQKGPLP